MSLLAVGGLAWFALALVVGLIVGPMLGALGHQPCREMATRYPRRAEATRYPRRADPGRTEPGDRRQANERVSKIS